MSTVTVSITVLIKPSVFPIWLGFIIQPYLHSLDITVLVAIRDKQAALAGNRPCSPFHIKSRNTVEIVKVGQHTGQEPTGGIAGRQGAVHVLFDALLTQTAGYEIGPVLGGQFQV